MFNKIETPKRAHMAAQMLLEGIKTQKLTVGDKLPPERIIAQEMNLSRNTVREAIVTLQIMGILETRHSQGNFVINTVDENNYETFLSLIFKTDDSPFKIVDARIAFEPGVALICSRKCSEKDIKSLSSRIDLISQALDDNDIKTYRREDQIFHLSIAQMTRNTLIINTISSLLKSMKNPLWQAMKNALANLELRENRKKEHRDIFQAIAAGDEALIITAVQTHLEKSKLRFLVEDNTAGDHTPL